MRGSGAANPTVLRSEGVVGVTRVGVGRYHVNISGSLDGYLVSSTNFMGVLKLTKTSPMVIETYDSHLTWGAYDLQSDDILDFTVIK